MNTKTWLFGQTKKDRQGRTIYFIEYTNQFDSLGNQIELWEPEDIFLARDTNYIESFNGNNMKKYFALILMVFGSFGTFAEDKLEITQASYPILVDVRTDAEWNDGYIETAIHIPLDRILQKIELATESKQQTIYLYCKSGKRSAKAEKALQSIGYINAKNIGGINQASSNLQLKITNE